MDYQVLARKWRPKKFEEVIGQSHIVRTIKNSIINNRIAQAYLLTGTRGVGKTTIARLFAKSLMCEKPDDQKNPCGVCPSCVSIDDGSSIDYTEIDGATNNGVESIRQLIENVQYLPVSGKYKVYVIDEVHMLSVSAFNALLKTLEEPPKHVIFIFATTDPQKLLGTVLSRCQRFDFKNLTFEELVEHVNIISSKENIRFENENIVRILAKRGKGSVRDTLSLLDQALGLSEEGLITESSLSLSLGLANTKALSTIINAIIIGDSATCSQMFRSILDENVDLKVFVEQITEKFYQIIQSLDDESSLSELDIDLNAINELSTSELFWIYEVLIKDLGWALSSIAPEDVVSVVLKKVSMRRELLASKDQKLSLKKKIKIEQTPIVKPSSPVSSNQKTEKSEEKEVSPTIKKWDEFLEFVFQKNPAVAANLEHGNIISLSQSEEELNILFGFKVENKFFYDHTMDSKIMSEINSYLQEYFKVSSNELNFELKLVGADEASEKKFKSKSEVVKEKIENTNNIKKEELLNNKFVKEAEKIFLTKVDKVILKE